MEIQAIYLKPIDMQVRDIGIHHLERLRFPGVRTAATVLAAVLPKLSRIFLVN
jgi:hypothetical protein